MIFRYGHTMRMVVFRMAHLLVLAILLYPCTEARSQFVTGSSVFGGGGTTSTSSTYNLQSTIGQVATGIQSGSITSLSAGFWYTTGPGKTDVSDRTDLQSLPREFRLYQNYPNPFNPATRIRFSVPNDEHVTLFVYDLLGREVAKLIDTRLTSGEHYATFDAQHLSSGIYIYRLHSGNRISVRRMMLLK
jgi:hypothetical protein